ncbi:MAG: M23 family metallopeptidase [Candidatus Caenarcaniphilales bacterium]|nr:M23 family metallopeptidase [Candidatus Caenarcaniphilales bacterium]
MPLRFTLLIAFFISISASRWVEAGMWIRPSEIKQGETIFLSGLYWSFGDQYSLLGDCQLDFNGSTYPFYLDLVSPEEYKLSGGQNGYQFISRLPTTPLTKTGEHKIVLKCPLGEEKFNINVIDGKFPLQNIQLSAAKNSLSATEKEKRLVADALKTRSNFRLWDPQAKWITPSSAERSSAYGLSRKYNGVLAKNYFHKGIDFAASAGAPVKAPADGKVLLVGSEKDGFLVHGNCIFIDHGQGIISAYLHLTEAKVIEGDLVKMGDLIGTVGDTGIATGPHLHFGLYLNQENIDPNPWLNHPIP